MEADTQQIWMPFVIVFLSILSILVLIFIIVKFKIKRPSIYYLRKYYFSEGFREKDFEVIILFVLWTYFAIEYTTVLSLEVIKPHQKKVCTCVIILIFHNRSRKILFLLCEILLTMPWMRYINPFDTDPVIGSIPSYSNR